MRRRAFLGALALLVSVPASLPAAQPASPPAAAARAPAPAPRWREFPFALKLDIAVVDEVVGSAPPQLLAAIASS